MLVVKYFKKLLHFLVNVNNPLLGPHLTLMKFVGIWRPDNDYKSKFKLLTVYITLGFFFSQYIKFCLNTSAAAFKPLMQYAPFHISAVKTAFFIKDHAKWTELFAYISSVEHEELRKKDPEIKRIRGYYIKYSHRLTYCYWILIFLSNLSIYTSLCLKVYRQTNPSEEYINIFDGYTPWKRDPPGYYNIFITQTLFGNMITVYVMAWDPLIVCVMIFFANQLKVSGVNCKKAIDVTSVTSSRRNIAECHKFHITLMKYQEVFNSLISPVMFVYLAVITINFGAFIIEMVELRDDFRALMSYCVYVLTCLIQLLNFYWHSNEVKEESSAVSYNAFRSNWPGADIQLQKDVALLGYAVNKKLVFRAGPFHDISLTTFVSILRGSYSFYTLLSETN